jgi:hypothetical protein
MQRGAGFAPSAMTWQGGVLYYAADLGIYALDEGGGMPRLLTADFAERLRLDGERLLYIRQFDQLFAVPLLGGQPTLLADGMTYDPNVQTETYALATIDADSVYWMFASPDGSGAVWRMAQTGGPAQKLSQLPMRSGGTTRRNVEGMEVIGDVVVIAYGQGDALAVPKAGGAPRSLVQSAATFSLLGFDHAGALYAHEDLTATERLYTIVRTEANGGAPGAFWPSMPQSLDPQGVFPVGDGWLVVDFEGFADQTTRTSAWLVNSTQTAGHRAGCLPDGALVEVKAVAESPSSVFLSVEQLTRTDSGDGATWAIVRIPR